MQPAQKDKSARTVDGGEGQIVAVADTGFDKGSTSDVHPAFTGRVKKLHPLGRKTANDPNGHGTHVCGSVLGDGSSSVIPNNSTIQGSAPKAHLIMQSILDPIGHLGGIPNDLTTLFQTPYDEQARVHTNSWGSDQPGVYNQRSKEVDAFVWKHRDCVVCFAAGNEGTDGNRNGVVDLGSVSPPSTAKNCITVGASENNRPEMNQVITYGAVPPTAGWPRDFPTEPIRSDPAANNPNGMAAFSSRGPAQGNRMKPDVVAPGTFVLSTRSRDTASKGWKASEDPLYMYEGGTSMATPLVAGCAALTREYLATRHNMENPSAALVKAMLINSADPIPGQYAPSETGLIPNNNCGFGRVNMNAMFNGQYQLLLDEDKALDTSESFDTSFEADLKSSGTRLTMTLVWTDYPGPTLQNDLDLIFKMSIQSTHVELHGNQPAGSTAFDRTNNVEQIVYEFSMPFVSMEVDLAVEVAVRAHRILQDKQTFALVVRQSYTS